MLPTIIIKDEDRAPLRRWQADNGVPIHVWQVFYDLAFGIALDAAERLIESGAIQPCRAVGLGKSGDRCRSVRLSNPTALLSHLSAPPW